MKHKPLTISLIVLGALGAAIAAVDSTTQPSTRPAEAAATTEPTAATPSTTRPVRLGMTDPSNNNRRSWRRGQGNQDQAASSSAASDLATVPSPTPLSHDYDILNLRNIFYHGHLPPPEGSRPREQVVDRHAVEITLIFNGVTITNGEPVAYLENTDEGVVQQVRLGDSIARGKITNIDLDSLDYESNGKTTHVEIGQNLAGGSGWGTLSSNTPVASQPTPGANASVLEKLRQRRSQELGAGGGGGAAGGAGTTPPANGAGATPPANGAGATPPANSAGGTGAPGGGN